MTALLSGAVVTPGLAAPANASAAEASAVVADECKSHVATYVLEGPAGPAIVDPAKPRTLRKYVDWDSKSTDASGTLIDTELTATLPGKSSIFTAGRGTIYEITEEGKLQSYKDNTATGGPLLTPAKTYGTGWLGFTHVWAGGARIYGQNAAGEIAVYKVADPATAAGAITPTTSRIPADNPAAVAMKDADDVWTAGDQVFVLKDGQITASKYAERVAGLPPNQTVNPSLGVPAVVASGLTGAKQAWSPGPGAVRTHSGRTDYAGQIKSYAGVTSLALANDDLRVGIYGQIHADTADCLADATQEQPSFGTKPDDSDLPPAVSDDEPDPTPGDAKVFKGQFVLGDGSPAAGMPVVVEAIDTAADDGTVTELPVLGTTTTTADGTWALQLPANLPAAVQAAADENGGAVNAMATTNGKTSTGVAMTGVDHLTAAPDTAEATARQLVASDADGQEATALLPADTQDTEPTQPTDEEYAKSWSAQQQLSPIGTDSDSPTPKWQNATGDLPVGFDPYKVNGADTKSMTVTPFDGGCDRTKNVAVSKKISYTVVGEAHANWDAKASVDYDNKLATTVEIAVKTGSNWAIQGSASRTSSMGVSTGYTNRGPYFAKQWKVPLEYVKYQETWKCGGNNTFIRYKIVAMRYKVPSGGATGAYGKDMRYKDGYAAFSKSPKSHRAYVTAGSYFQLSKGRSYKYGGAVSVYGASMGASSQYDSEHRQRITAGTKADFRHDIWGRNSSVSGKPGVFYSY
ncbi:hypothetical protein [Streptomyces clavifer]|uniref:hypothetical protein n=1 Tax=Streptomyces clavifer TaxID=68188 RepID=UPI00382A00DA